MHKDKVAASATCQNEACNKIALKIVNFFNYTQVRCLDSVRALQLQLFPL
jgi:hypothetical protein